MRLGDCCRLDWSQVGIAQGVIQLVPKKTGRHDQRIVTIPIHPALGSVLVGDGAVGLRALPSGPVLPTVAELYACFRWQVSHDLAQTFRRASFRLPCGLTDGIVGRESTAMTRHYYHESADALKSAVTAIPTQ